MTIYYQRHVHVVKRNAVWGQLLGRKDRPVLSADKEVFAVDPEKTSSLHRIQAIMDIIAALQSLPPGRCLEIIVPALAEAPSRPLLLKLLGFLVRKLYPGVVLEFAEFRDRYKDFHPPRDVLYLAWKLIAGEKIIRDYVIEKTAAELRIRLLPYQPAEGAVQGR